MKPITKQHRKNPTYQNGDCALYCVEQGGRCEWLPCHLDYQDLKWQKEKPNEFHRAHRPMPLDQKGAICLGFKKESNCKEGDMTYRGASCDLCLSTKNRSFYFELQHGGKAYELPLIYVHELQALMRCMLGVSPLFNYKRYESIKRYQHDQGRLETTLHRSYMVPMSMVQQRDKLQ